jgi:hypothetical protein
VSYRYIVANGCSCTRGQELDNPAEESWPHVLARLIGAEAVNLARNGSSNRRIVRSTVERLPALLAEFACDPSEVLLILCWSEFSRHEYHSEVELANHRQGPDEHKTEIGWELIGSWRNGRKHRPTQAFYRYLWSEHGQAVNFCVDWLTLDAYVRALGVDVRYGFVFPAADLWLPDVRHLSSQLPLSRVLGLRPDGVPQSFIAMTHHLPKGPGGHPLAAAHDVFAQAIAGWLQLV